MKTTAFLILVFLRPYISNSQTMEEVKLALQSVERVNQIDDFKASYPDWGIYEGTTLVMDDSPLPNIVNANTGEVFEQQFRLDTARYVVKILEEREVEWVQVKYIYLDRNQLSEEELIATIAEIHSKYNEGIVFLDLVKAYTMDGNLTGDLIWYRKDGVLEEIDQAARPRKQRDIFNVSVANGNGYYVVLKTHENRTQSAKIYVAVQFYR